MTKKQEKPTEKPELAVEIDEKEPFMMPKWLKDIQSHADSIEWGQIQVTIHKIANKVKKLEHPGYQTIKPKSNSEVVETILFILEDFQDHNVTGNLAFVVSYKEGKMELLSIQSNKVDRYDNK